MGFELSCRAKNAILITLSISLSLSHTHTHTLSLSHTLTLSLSLSLSHTHTLSLSLPPSYPLSIDYSDLYCAMECASMAGPNDTSNNVALTNSSPTRETLLAHSLAQLKLELFYFFILSKNVLMKFTFLFFTFLRRLSGNVQLKFLNSRCSSSLHFYSYEFAPCSTTSPFLHTSHLLQPICISHSNEIVE